MIGRKYYEAYDDRYRQVHGEKLRWFDDAPTPLVKEVMNAFGISSGAKVLEIGCGEGRDARHLLKIGYDLLATDVSEEAIRWCREADPDYADRYQVLDCVAGNLEEKYDFLYAVAVLHMLVEDEDRNGFYQFIKKHLKKGGIGLICSMGDGQRETRSDILKAFDRQERIHLGSGKVLQLTSTSYRAVSFDTFREEPERNGLKILKMGLADGIPDYYKLMYAVVTTE